MESILSGGEDFLLPGLSYDLSGDQASYVVSRRQSQINSQVPTAGPDAVRQVSFTQIRQDSWTWLVCVSLGPWLIITLQIRAQCFPQYHIVAGVV